LLAMILLVRWRRMASVQVEGNHCVELLITTCHGRVIGRSAMIHVQINRGCSGQSRQSRVAVGSWLV
jgi:hypothetical protein